MTDIKPLMTVLAAPLRILLVAAFILLGKMGWLTWATPEAMHQTVNALMDFLVVLVPTLYAIWAGFNAWRNAQPETIVAKAAALPEVARVVTTPAIVDKLDDPAVTTR